LVAFSLNGQQGDREIGIFKIWPPQIKESGWHFFLYPLGKREDWTLWGFFLVLHVDRIATHASVKKVVTCSR
jgi:hypothetical protein